MKPTNKKVWMIAMAVAMAVGLTAQLSPVWAGDVEELMAQGNAYFNQGRYEDAEACFLEVIRMRPNNAQAHHDLGFLYYHMGFFIDAVDEFHTALRLDPNHIHAHYNLGYIYAQSEYFEGAFEEYRWLKDRDPAVAKRLVNVIAAKKAEVTDTPSEDFVKDEGEWVSLLDETANPDQPVTSSGSGQSQNAIKEAEDWNYKGVQYTAGQRDREAFAAFTKAVQLDPNKAEYWKNRSGSAGQLQDLEQALQDINRAIQLEPNNGMYWLHKSAILIKLERWDEAKHARAQACRCGESCACD